MRERKFPWYLEVTLIILQDFDHPDIHDQTSFRTFNNFEASSLFSRFINHISTSLEP